MSQWHPILATVEPSPGVFNMIDPTGKHYATVRLVRRGGEMGYRADCGEQLVGYYTNLRAACMGAHMTFIGNHGQGGPVNGVLTQEEPRPTPKS